MMIFTANLVTFYAMCVYLLLCVVCILMTCVILNQPTLHIRQLMASPLFDLNPFVMHTPCSPTPISKHANAKHVRILLMFPTPNELLNDLAA